MIIVKDKTAIKKMENAGQLLSAVFDDILLLVCPGISTLELDTCIANRLEQKGLVSQSKGYKGYRHVSCISINDEVVHGIPAARTLIKNGDLVKIDVCAAWQGYCADMARTFLVGEGDEKTKKFVAVAVQALNKGIEQAMPGNYVSDISAAIQKEVEIHGFGVVRVFAGHGIGRHMHEEPEILNYGQPGKGAMLKPGMTLAIEPMITMGKFDVYVADDGWTAKTADKSLAAHVEDTVVVTENGPKVITRPSV